MFTFLLKQDIEEKSTRLEPAMEDLQDFIDTLTSENENLRPLVDNATAHAEKLAMQAERMLQ